MNASTEVRSIKSLERPSTARALAVDLDGTLVKTDLLLESLVSLLKQRPWSIFGMLLWLLKGKAHFKQQVSRRAQLDVSALPYRSEVLDYVKTHRAGGCTIVLTTAADRQVAQQVADYLRLFDLILASDGTTNLSGESKRDRLVKEFGEKGFDYIGNERRDLPVWSSAERAIMVNPGPALRSRVAQVTQVDREFAGQRRSVADHLKALRLQHWVKNLLVFVPLLAAHRMDEIALVGRLLLAFVASGCIASGGYLINDLLDLPADRRHPTKKFRPFAAGDLSLSYGLAMIPILIGLGCFIGKFVSALFLAAVLAYLALSLIYSLRAKWVVVLDVILLAGLYTMRIMAGAAAVAIWPSHWLLAFSTFLFFSLALVKRYGELAIMRQVDGDRAHARGYELSDAELLAAMGIASGYLAVLVLALYISSQTAQRLYGHYELIWFLCPLLLYWISQIWLIAHRGKMFDDPVVFALRDRSSRILIALMLAVSIFALDRGVLG